MADTDAQLYGAVILAALIMPDMLASTFAAASRIPRRSNVLIDSIADASSLRHRAALKNFLQARARCAQENSLCFVTPIRLRDATSLRDSFARK